MGLKGLPGVLDIRAVGLVAAIDLASRPDGVGKRGFEIIDRGFHHEDITLRAVGDTLALTPPLIMSEAQIGEIFDKVGKLIRSGDVGARSRTQRAANAGCGRRIAQPTVSSPSPLPELQPERRLHLGVGRQRPVGHRHHVRIAVGPHHHRALAAQVAEIDPGRAPRIAVDQHARLLGGVVARHCRRPTWCRSHR